MLYLLGRDELYKMDHGYTHIRMIDSFEFTKPQK